MSILTHGVISGRNEDAVSIPANIYQIARTLISGILAGANANSENRIRGTKDLSSYCQYAPGDPLHQPYHDLEYGFPLTDDNELFERLVLEINQAGLSWATILRKRENFLRAYDNFDLKTVAAYDEDERARLLADAGIIRNRLKIDAVIENELQHRIRGHGVDAVLRPHHSKAVADDRAGFVPGISRPIAPSLQLHAIRRHKHGKPADAELLVAHGLARPGRLNLFL